MKFDNEKLRKDCKITKIITENEYTFEDMAGVIDITIGGFYNWLSGAYELKSDKFKKLRGFIDDIIH